MNRPDYSEGGRPAPDPSSVPEEPGDPDGLPEQAALVLSASAGQGERLDRFLARALAGSMDGLSRSRIQQWIALGAVWSDERPLAADTRLLGFETLHVQPMPRDADRSFAPDDVALQIVDEDAQLMVIDKQAGLVMHPAAGNWRNTLLNGLLFHRPALARLPRAGIVHRLDRDTSGLLVVAKTEAALSSLSAQLASRTVSRRYLAFVQGVPPERATVDEPVGRDPRTRVRMAVVAPPAGRPSVTRMARLAVAELDGRKVSLVECRLETGRTHQIRVHMRHLGHPLLGDALYGGPMSAIGRQALHAWRLGLVDPATGRARHWTSVPPPDLRELARACGLDLERICEELERNAGD